MGQNQRLFLLIVLIALLFVMLGVLVGACAYFWGALGAKICLIALGCIALVLLAWFIVMASINRVSYIYRDAAQTIVDFQMADDRGEVMRHLATVVKSGSQLDKSVLALAGRMAQGQARAIVQNERQQIAMNEQQQRRSDQDAIDSQWWTTPEFGDNND